MNITHWTQGGKGIAEFQEPDYAPLCLAMEAYRDPDLAIVQFEQGGKKKNWLIHFKPEHCDLTFFWEIFTAIRAFYILAKG